jgi:hypothetical protein
MVYGFWFMVYDFWFLVFLVSGFWYIVYGLRFTIHFLIASHMSLLPSLQRFFLPSRRPLGDGARTPRSFPLDCDESRHSLGARTLTPGNITEFVR